MPNSETATNIILKESGEKIIPLVVKKKIANNKTTSPKIIISLTAPILQIYSSFQDLLFFANLVHSSYTFQDYLINSQTYSITYLYKYINKHNNKKDGKE